MELVVELQHGRWASPLAAQLPGVRRVGHTRFGRAGRTIPDCAVVGVTQAAASCLVATKGAGIRRCRRASAIGGAESVRPRVAGSGRWGRPRWTEYPAFR